ncbi:MAG: site-specific DNA-methyltransferase [Casimicrobiaceae bacterium]
MVVAGVRGRDGVIDTCYIGDVRDGLRAFIAAGIRAQTCVTSPPYWRQRDYGMAGQIGLEQHPDDFVAALVDVFRLVRDVLADDGTLWVNIGDKWASGGHGGGGSFMADRGEAWAHAKDAKGWRSPPAGYKDKDLVGIPWMLAFALRADGWFLRQCNVWAKPNGMPESVTDRSTASHEYVFQLSKRNNYFYNAADARTLAAPSSETRLAQNVAKQAGSTRANGGEKTNGSMKAVGGNPRVNACSAPGIDSRKHVGAVDANLRSVWWISPAQSSDGHYAVMPSELAAICIVAGSRPGDIVLDPFMGSGTVAQVAQDLGRRWIGCELNPEYVAMQDRRTAQAGMAFA